MDEAQEVLDVAGYLTKGEGGEFVPAEGDWLRFGSASKEAQQALMSAPPSDKMINMKAFGAAQDDAREALAQAEKDAKAMIEQAQVDLKQATRNFKLAKSGASAEEINMGAVTSEMESALVVGETIAEGLEEASGDEENGFVVFHGRFEDVADLKGA